MQRIVQKVYCNNYSIIIREKKNYQAVRNELMAYYENL